MFSNRIGRVLLVTSGVCLAGSLAVYVMGCGGGTAPVTNQPGIVGSTGNLTGVVLNPDLNAVPGVRVTVQQGRSRQDVVTDANGQYTFVLPFNQWYTFTYDSGTTRIVGPLQQQVYLADDNTSVQAMIVQLIDATQPNVTIQTVDANAAASGFTIDVPGADPATGHVVVRAPAGALAPGVEIVVVNLADAAGGAPGVPQTSEMAPNQILLQRAAAFIQINGGQLQQPATVEFQVDNQFNGQQLELIQYNPTTGQYESTRSRAQLTVVNGTATATISGPGTFSLGSIVTVNIQSETQLDQVSSELDAYPHCPTKTTKNVLWNSTVTYVNPATVPNNDKANIRTTVRNISNLTGDARPAHMPANLQTYAGKGSTNQGINSTTVNYCTPAGTSVFLQQYRWLATIQLLDSGGTALYTFTVDYRDPESATVAHSQGGGSGS